MRKQLIKNNMTESEEKSITLQTKRDSLNFAISIYSVNKKTNTVATKTPKEILSDADVIYDWLSNTK